jgi:hypothetical protein
MTCQEIGENSQVSTAHKQKMGWEYEFELQNLGQMGTFLYRIHPEMKKVE